MGGGLRDAVEEGDVEGRTGHLPAHDGQGPAGRERRRRDVSSQLLAGAILVALVPIIVAAVRGISDGWVPAGDNGLIAIRSRDVLDGRVPLLGLWSSASAQAADHFNHPGPLLFDLFAVPTLLFGRIGPAVGAAALNIAAVIGIALVARRHGGPLVATVAAAAAAALCWTMGSALLFDPWHANSILLTFLLFLVLVWAVSGGDLVLLPLTAAVASLVFQTNLGYGLLVPPLCGWGLLGLALDVRRRRRANPLAWPDLRRRVRRTVALGAFVLVVCWAQPLVEQLTGDGEGNGTRAARGLGEVTSTLGLDEGLRLFAGVLALPPLWFRPSMRTVYDALPSSGAALVGLALLAGVLAVCAWDARRRADRVSLTATVTAAIAAVLGLLSVARTPADVFGAVAPYQTRLLWPLGAFVALAVAVTLARRVAGGLVRPTPVIGLFAAVIVVTSIANIPRMNNGTDSPGFTQPIARELNLQLEDLEVEGALYYDWQNRGTRAETFVQHYGSAVLAELTRRDIAFVSDNEMLLRSVGEDRRYTGDNADARLTIRTGDAAYEPPTGATTVALNEGLDGREQRELEDLEDRIGDYIRAGRLRLTDEASAALGRLDDGEGDSADPGADPEELLESGGLVGLVRRGFLVLEPPWDGRFARYAELRRRHDLETVAVFVTPLGP
ncbi:hypothetical protein BH18ACT1_BH18ACT1_11970 [soil metagenome]